MPIDTTEARRLIDEGVSKLDAALQGGASEQLEKYFDVMSRFHSYSFRNLMLILMQCENATRVAGFGRWKQLGRHVKKGESAIGILAPIRIGRSKMKAKDGEKEEEGTLVGFKIVPVFDISQTEGEPLPEFAKAEGSPGEHLAKMMSVITEAGIRLREASVINGANGSFDAESGELTYRPDLTEAERFRVLTHEWAHKLLRHCERKFEMAQSVQETEAEAIAFVVCNALGIDSTDRSSDYIQLHRGDATLLRDSLEIVQRTAATILKALDTAKPFEGTVSIEPTAIGAATSEEPPECNHTLSLDDAGSTWTAEESEEGTRYYCNCCGKFYGIAPNGESVSAPATLLEEEAECDDEEDETPERRIGRADYHERREAQIERLEERAAKARSGSNSAYNQAHKMGEAIPMGQPILVGHHSEGRDSRYRERINNKMGKSIELGDKAKRLEERASAAESNNAISADNPDALELLREKLAKLERKHDFMKKLNAAWRKAGAPASTELRAWHEVGKALDIPQEAIERMAKSMKGVDHYSNNRDRAPAPPYALTNNGANIRRVKERITELEQEATVCDSSETDHGVCIVRENVDINRIQLVFSGKPDEEVRSLLKRHGFRWARSERAWQRLLNQSGRNTASYVVGELQKLKGECNECSANPA